MVKYSLLLYLWKPFIYLFWLTFFFLTGTYRKRNNPKRIHHQPLWWFPPSSLHSHQRQTSSLILLYPSWIQARCLSWSWNRLQRSRHPCCKAGWSCFCLWEPYSAQYHERNGPRDCSAWWWCQGYFFQCKELQSCLWESCEQRCQVT